MERKRLKKWIFAAVCFVLVLLFLDWKQSHFTLRGVSDMVCTEDAAYLIDNQGKYYHILRLDREGRMTGRIQMPKLSGMWWNVYDNLSVDEDGTVYVYEYGRTMDTNEPRSMVYQCDFKASCLKPAWELPAAKLLKVQVVNGAVCYPAASGKDETGIYRVEKGGTPELICRIPVPYSHMINVWYDEQNGVFCTDWNCRFFRNGEELMENARAARDYVNISVGQAGITYMDLQDGWVKRLDWESEEAKRMIPIEQIHLQEPEHTEEDIFPFHYEEDGSFCAGIDKSTGSRVAGEFDAGGNQTAEYEYLTAAWNIRLLNNLRTAALLAFFLGVIAAAAAAFFKKSGGMIPIVLKLIGILIPVFAVSALVINHSIEVSLRERIVRMNHDLLYIMADRMLSSVDTERFGMIDWQKGAEGREWKALWEAPGKSSMGREIYNVDDDEIEPVIASTYQWVFLMERGDYRYVKVDGKHYFGNRLRYDRDRLEMDKIETAVSRDAIIKTEYNDFTGDFLALYVPIHNKDGAIVGVLESGLNMRIVLYEVEKQMRQIRFLMSVLLVLLCSVLSVVLGISLNPLGKLKMVMGDVSAGNLGRTVQVQGRDEVALIAGAFNQMSIQLKEQVAFIQLCADRYAAFVPERVFAILRRENITQVCLGDQEETLAAVLEISSNPFRRMARSLDGDRLYRMINDSLAEMIPIVAEHGGIVDHMKEDGLTVYYPEGASDALKAAVSICQHLNYLREKDEKIPVYSAALNYGPVRVGIVGGQERMAAATIAEIMTMAEFYSSLAEKYGSRVLVTASLTRQIPDFESAYHFRRLGYVYLKTAGTLETIYDVYDGDEPEAFRIKDETAEAFAQAVDAYLAQQYYEARLKFAQVLRRNPKDAAAREYVYRCDAYYQSEDKQEMTAWLEQYG